MQQCVDKYEVRKYVEECGLSEILIPIVGVYDDVRDIKIEELPGAVCGKRYIRWWRKFCNYM